MNKKMENRIRNMHLNPKFFSNRAGSATAFLIAIALVAIVVVACVIVGWFATYNALVAADVNVDQSWSQVRNVYQRQADLIPNLVESTKGYMNFEERVLANVTAARTAWLSAQVESQAKQDEAGAKMNIATGALLATQENYPELKSSTVIINLMDELAGSQNRISTERGRYIEAIGDYNTMVRSFPSNIVAGASGFTLRAYYQGDAGIEEPPVVSFP